MNLMPETLDQLKEGDFALFNSSGYHTRSALGMLGYDGVSQMKVLCVNSGEALVQWELFDGAKDTCDVPASQLTKVAAPSRH